MYERDDGTLDPSDTRRIHEGLAPEVERYRFPEIFGAFRPEELRNDETVPLEVQSQLEDIFGDLVRGKNPRLRLRMHPWFRRWALFERAGDKYGEGEAHHCVWVCGVGEGRTGYAPPDLWTSDRRHAALWSGVHPMGRYRLPDKRDFELVRRVSFRQLSLSERMDASLAEGREKKAQRTREWEAREHDLCSYYALDEMARQNQEQGGGQKLYSTFVDHRTNVGVDLRLTSPRYEKEEVRDADGRLLYTLLQKISAERQWEMIKEKALAQRAARGLSRPSNREAVQATDLPPIPTSQPHPLSESSRELAALLHHQG